MKYSAKWAVALSVTAAAVLVACGGGGGLDVQDTSAKGTSAPTTVPTSTALVNSIAGTTPITFSTGVAELGTTGKTDVVITAAATAGGDPSMTVTEGAEEFSADFLIGSITYTRFCVASSRFVSKFSLPGVIRRGDVCYSFPIISRPRIPTFNIIIPQISTGTNLVPITIQIGNTISTPVNKTVTLSVTGGLTINNTPAGTVTVAPITGGS
jgi:hypothetical protein